MAPLLLCLLLQDCTSWYEPFMGSAAVTLNKCRHKIEVINDLDGWLVHLFKVAANPETAKILLERLLKLPYSESEFVCAKRAYANNFKNVSDPIRQAELVFVLITQSFNSTRQSWRKGISQREYTQLLERNLPEAFRRLQVVHVHNMDALEVIRRIKGNGNAQVLLDPPYRHELRGKGATSVYTHEMDTQRQIQLLELIRDAQCRIILCGYRSEDGHDLYDEYLLPHGWKHYLAAELVKSCQSKSNKDTGKEWIWVNYQLPEIARYFINLSTADW